MGKNLYDKVWESHTVREMKDGRSQLFVGLHLIHEVTSPQAFGMLDELGLEVRYPNRTFATIDHIIPTHNQLAPFEDVMAQKMAAALRENTEKHGIEYFDFIS